MIKKIIKLIKIVVPLIIVLLVLGRVFITPILDEEGAKGKREPLYVKKNYKNSIGRKIREMRESNNSLIPLEIKEKYFIKDAYIGPYIFSRSYGNQIEKSSSSPYDFNIFIESFVKDEKVTVSNVKVFEKNFYFYKKKIFELEDKREIVANYFVKDRYISHYNYTKDLNVSKIYMKPLIVTFDVSGKVDGKIVTKSMEYTLNPVIERGVQGPMWMYQ